MKSPIDLDSSYSDYLRASMRAEALKMDEEIMKGGTMSDMKTLGDELPREQARVRELLVDYKSIGANGAFGAMNIERDLKEADEAVMSGDIVRMIQAYKKLKDCQ